MSIREDALAGKVTPLFEECARNGLPIISVPVCALGIADFNVPVRRFHVERRGDRWKTFGFLLVP